jgi:hypothetical protein
MTRGAIARSRANKYFPAHSFQTGVTTRELERMRPYEFAGDDPEQTPEHG